MSNKEIFNRIAFASNALKNYDERWSQLHKVLDALNSTPNFQLKSLERDIVALQIRESESILKLINSFEAEHKINYFNKASYFNENESAYKKACAQVINFNKQFMAPDIKNISSIISKIDRSIFRDYNIHFEMFSTKIRALKNPFLDIRNSLSSLENLARLQGIVRLSAEGSFHDERQAHVLRGDLGDWRDPISFPENNAEDVAVRHSLYLERGYNPDLTNFPDATFDQWVEGLRNGESLSGVSFSHPDEPSSDNESYFRRNNEVHDFFQKFEAEIRNFIHGRMSAQFGEEWPRQRLPNGMFERWIAKRDKDRGKNGWPLIFYADFTDYSLIICRDDNWKTVFSPIFDRLEFVRESFQRLFMPRNATMHSRPLSRDDALFALVEMKRLAGALRSRS